VSERQQDSTMGSGSLEARSGSSLGRSSFVDAPAERRAPGSSPAVEARAHVGDEEDG
jgi:hypothetical protein